MNREQAKALLPIFQAFANGQDIQVKHPLGTNWQDATLPTFSPEMLWRIAPEPVRYRRYLRTAQASSFAPNQLSVGCYHDNPGADVERFANNLSGFVRWIDNDWIKETA